MTVFRLAASSYSGALLTVGTRVTPHAGRYTREPHIDDVGIIEDIRENKQDGEVLVLWPNGVEEWRSGRNLDRVGYAVRDAR